MTTQVAQERDRVSGQCVNILYTYRKFCATASSSGQLILPEALKLLPLYTMGKYELTATCGLGCYADKLLSAVVNVIRKRRWYLPNRFCEV